MPGKKRKRTAFVKWIRIIIILLFIGVAVYFGTQWLLFRRAMFVRYPQFGISIPASYPIHGIDVSRYQQMIAWEEVKAMQVKNIKLGFAFIKATEGIGNMDRLFPRNWKKVKEAGIIRGAYHFFLATKDGKMQAENFIKYVNLEPGDMPPVLDIEQTYGTSSSVLKKEVKEWLDVIENYYGIKPIIYTNVEFYNRYLGSDFDNYPLWVAHYLQPNQPRIKRDWLFWQHSETGRVNGILTTVDFNVFSGDSAEFKSILIP